MGDVPPLAAPSPEALRVLLHAVVADRHADGHDVEGLAQELDALPGSYDALLEFGTRLADLPMRSGWPYREPDDLDAIRAECDPSRPTGPLAALDPAESADRAETAFLAAVCGCVLGKPLELALTSAEIRAVLEPLGEWPVRDYLTEQAVFALPYQHLQWPELVRERLSHVAPDDDINYRILGMLVLEDHGLSFGRADLRRLWALHLPVVATFGPERTLLARLAAHALLGDPLDATDPAPWTVTLNPGDELCGALIRVDAYAYACLGSPELAAELAWRDATLTHRKTGVYAAMFVAAAIAAAPVARDPLEIFRTALRYVPARSRFSEAVAEALELVAGAADWRQGYELIHGRFGEFGHCRVLQEVGTVINTVRFAADVGDGIGLQVSQGNDTDSFGATAGSILGAWFGPAFLDERWVSPFGDDLHTALALFHERSLSAVARRMRALPGLALGATTG